MKKIRVAIIDSGINLSHNSLRQYVKVLEAAPHLQNTDDEVGHGTAVADLITRAASSDVLELIVYRLFGDSMEVRIDKLLETLRYVEKFEPDIINCSFGSIDPDVQKLLTADIKRLLGSGILIVAACNDEGHTAWPAGFQGVIRVRSGNIHSLTEWEFERSRKNTYIFRGLPQRARWKEGKYAFIGGSSFAAALCTREIVRYLSESNTSTKETVIAHLENNATKITEITAKPSDLIPWNNIQSQISKVFLYPFYKEMHAFLRFEKELSFSITGIADYRRSKNSHKCIQEIMPDAASELIINDGLPANMAPADTLIIGYLDRISQACNQDLLEAAIRQAFDQGLNVFSFLPVNSQRNWTDAFANKGLWIYVPQVEVKQVQAAIELIREKPSFNTPILGIFGTSSKQGKFTLQLSIRYELLNRGFKIAQIGTEHHSGLFGINYTFPIGYGMQTSVRIPFDLYIPYLRRILSELDEQEYDTIIVGGQSGIMSPDPYYYGCLPTELFMTSVIPDRIILMINKTDPPELIKRIESYIYARTGVKVYEKVVFETFCKDKENKIVKHLVDRMISEKG